MEKHDNFIKAFNSLVALAGNSLAISFEDPLSRERDKLKKNESPVSVYQSSCTGEWQVVWVIMQTDTLDTLAVNLIRAEELVGEMLTTNAARIRHENEHPVLYTRIMNNYHNKVKP